MGVARGSILSFPPATYGRKTSHEKQILPLGLKMFYIIGLGLCDEKDITIRGLEVPHASPRIQTRPS